MRISIQSPTYLPGLSFFDRMAQVDVVVLSDTGKVSRKNMGNRTFIKGRTGVQPLTIPVKRNQRLFHEVEIDSMLPWRERHWRKIEASYQQAQYWSLYKESIATAYQGEELFLSNFNIHLIMVLKEAFSIPTAVLVESELEQEFGSGSERVVKLCKHLGATTCLLREGEREGGRLLQTAGVKAEYHRYEQPEYPQLWESFIPRLAALDLLLNCGPDAHTILRRGRMAARSGES